MTVPMIIYISKYQTRNTFIISVLMRSSAYTHTSRKLFRYVVISKYLKIYFDI